MFVIGETNQEKVLDERIFKSSKFQLKIKLSNPSLAEKIQMMTKKLTNIGITLEKEFIEGCVDNKNWNYFDLETIMNELKIISNDSMIMINKYRFG